MDQKIFTSLPSSLDLPLTTNTSQSFQMLSSLPPSSPKKLLHLLSNSKSIHQTKQIHTQIIKNQNPSLLPSLIRLYSSQNHIHLAHRALHLHPNPPPTFAYNLLIRAYAIDGGSSPRNAVVLFDQMLLSDVLPDKFTFTFVVVALSMVSDWDNGRVEENIKPNEYTLVSLLIACTELGSLSLGRWVHEFAHKNGALDRRVYVGTALIDMYSKCGNVNDAIQVFNQMPIRSVATWNSMITSLGVHGYGKEAISLFKEMEQKSVKPDEITLVGALCACVREEMVEEGVMIFKDMLTKYAIESGIEHYRCLVELLDCKEADMIKDLIMELDVSDQRSLIKLCRENGNLKLEEIVSSCISSSVPREVECFQWEVG